MKIQMDMVSHNIGKRLSELTDPRRYLESGFDDIEQQVFCKGCGRSYRLKERVIGFQDLPCCPSRHDDVGCYGTFEELVAVRDKKHLAQLRVRARPPYPFKVRIRKS